MSVTMVFDLEGFGVLRELDFDAVMQEIPIDSATVTEHVRETKGTLNDHVILNSTKVTLEVFVTNTPVSVSSTPTLNFPVAELIAVPTPIVLSTTIKRWLAGAKVSGGGAVLPFRVNGIAPPQLPIRTTPARRLETPVTFAGVSQQYPVRKDRVREVYDTLLGLMRGRVSVQLLSDLRGYGDMVISSLSAPRVAEDGLTFTMELVEVNYADTLSVEVVKKAKPAEKRAEDAVVQGPQAPDIDFGDEGEGEGSTVARELLIGLANGVTQ